jgi:rRNA small subunit pseudouridine methyltransferase Nep1
LSAMLHIILLECALELVPQELTATKQVQKHAGRRKKSTHDLLLDQTYHGQAMTRLRDHERRGRPDITYLCLMSLLETPLCKSGGLQVHLHLQDGRVFDVSPEVRLPRNYDRFTGLMEQLLTAGRIPPEGEPLIKDTGGDLKALLTRIGAGPEGGHVYLATEGGDRTTLSGLAKSLPDDLGAPVVFGIGAFPHGSFSRDISSLFSKQLELDVDVMMAWHVCSELLWVYSFKHDVIRDRYLR